MHSVLYLVPMMLVRAAAPEPSILPLAVVPERFDTRAAEGLGLTLQDASGAPRAWSEHATTWTFVRVAGTQENREGFDGAQDARVPGAPVSIALPTPGVAMIGVEFEPWNFRMNREQLDAMLRTVVSDAEREAAMNAAPAQGMVRVRVTASAKSFVHILTPEGSTAPADAPQTVGSKSGQFNEIRLLLDPIRSLVGGDITVRFHADYDKAARARAFATNIDSGKAQEIASDASGIALFHLGEPGRWRVTFATVRPAPQGQDTDLIVHTASLTFAATRTEVKP